MTDREALRAKMENLEAVLKGGGAKPVSAPSLFPTPDDVAARVAEYARLSPGCRVLEPSAGTGQLVRAVLAAERTARVQAFEIRPELADAVRAVGLGVAACPADFLQEDPAGWELFDAVVMNPPFDKGADIRHVRHALRWLRPGGVLVAIVADGPRQGEAFQDFEHVESLPAGTFQGTNVRARIVRWEP